MLLLAIPRPYWLSGGVQTSCRRQLGLSHNRSGNGHHGRQDRGLAGESSLGCVSGSLHPLLLSHTLVLPNLEHVVHHPPLPEEGSRRDSSGKLSPVLYEDVSSSGFKLDPQVELPRVVSGRRTIVTPGGRLDVLIQGCRHPLPGWPNSDEAYWFRMRLYDIHSNHICDVQEVVQLLWPFN